MLVIFLMSGHLYATEFPFTSFCFHVLMTKGIVQDRELYPAPVELQWDLENCCSRLCFGRSAPDRLAHGKMRLRSNVWASSSTQPREINQRCGREGSGSHGGSSRCKHPDGAPPTRRSGVAIVPLARLRSPRDGMTSEAGPGPRPTQGFPHDVAQQCHRLLASSGLIMTVAFLQFDHPFREAE